MWKEEKGKKEGNVKDGRKWKESQGQKGKGGRNERREMEGGVERKNGSEGKRNGKDLAERSLQLVNSKQGGHRWALGIHQVKSLNRKDLTVTQVPPAINASPECVSRDKIDIWDK